jgi:hypothetical protein
MIFTWGWRLLVTAFVAVTLQIWTKYSMKSNYRPTTAERVFVEIFLSWVLTILNYYLFEWNFFRT